MERELEQLLIEKTRAKSERERFTQFEHRLRYMLCDLRAEVDLRDNCLLSDVQQAVIVFSMREKLGNNEGSLKKMDELFLTNVKNEFYEALRELEERHSDIKAAALIVKLFMEDFYFNK